MSKKKTQEEFERELSAIDSTILVRGQYLGNSEKIECECKTCGYVWKTRPADLLQGHGCPKCHHPSSRKTKDEFVSELLKVNRRCHKNNRPQKRRPLQSQSLSFAD